jgi:ABC-2 type transport system permease protein
MKIIKKNLPSMFIYVGIFLAILILFSKNTAGTIEKDFTGEKCKVAFMAEESSPLIDGFKQQLSKSAKFVTIEDSTEKLQDALYFRSVEYIIRIPKGFTDSFMKGEDVQLQKTIVPASVSNAFLDINIDQYFNTARLYVKNSKGITQEELVKHVNADLNTGTTVELKTGSQGNRNNSFASSYFNFLSYVILSVLILGISAIMVVFNNQDLQRRNFCSPIRAGSINIQFMLANFAFSFACWAIMAGAYFLFDSKDFNCTNTLYHLLNSLVFTFCSACISYLIGNVIKGREAISMVCNVVTLGASFISGAFVPQELLGDTVLKIGSFTPNYWYVKANNQIAQLTNFDYANLSPILSCILIELGFGIAFFILSLVIGKKKRMAS